MRSATVDPGNGRRNRSSYQERATSTSSTSAAQPPPSPPFPLLQNRTLSLMPVADVSAAIHTEGGILGQSLHKFDRMYAKPQSGDAKHYLDILLRERCLDEEFIVLQQQRDQDNNKDFVTDTYIDVTEMTLDELRSELGQLNLDFNKMQATVIKLLDSSLSIGATRVARACTEFKIYCEESSREECIKCFQKLRLEFIQVKHGLQTLKMLEREEAGAAGGLSGA